MAIEGIMSGKLTVQADKNDLQANPRVVEISNGMLTLGLELAMPEWCVTAWKSI